MLVQKLPILGLFRDDEALLAYARAKGFLVQLSNGEHRLGNLFHRALLHEGVVFRYLRGFIAGFVESAHELRKFGTIGVLLVFRGKGAKTVQVLLNGGFDEADLFFLRLVSIQLVELVTLFERQAAINFDGLDVLIVRVDHVALLSHAHVERQGVDGVQQREAVLGFDVFGFLLLHESIELLINYRAFGVHDKLLFLVAIESFHGLPVQRSMLIQCFSRLVALGQQGGVAVLPGGSFQIF